MCLVGCVSLYTQVWLRRRHNAAWLGRPRRSLVWWRCTPTFAHTLWWRPIGRFNTMWISILLYVALRIDAHTRKYWHHPLRGCVHWHCVHSHSFYFRLTLCTHVVVEAPTLLVSDKCLRDAIQGLIVLKPEVLPLGAGRSQEQDILMCSSVIRCILRLFRQIHHDVRSKETCFRQAHITTYTQACPDV